MTLGENIARLRTQKDWSQGDLADALGISRQSISKWETDTSIPELEKLIKLSELFGVTLDAAGARRGRAGDGMLCLRPLHRYARHVRAGKAPYHRRNSFIVYRRGHFGSSGCCSPVIC